MAYSDIDKPSEYFNTVLYTGNGSTQSISGLEFAPDLVWTKGRSVAYSHYWFDSVRGVGNRIISNSTSNEDGSVFGVSSFDTNGFTLGTDVGANNSGSTFTSWNWKAGGTAVSNTDGDIASTVSANTTSGFSIVSYTGTGANATVGHGLGVAPKMIICKGRSFSTSAHWLTYHEAMGNTSAMKLNLTSAKETTVYYWNNTSPTSSTFSLGGSTEANSSSETFIAYCFAEKKGYSKFGSYTGNGNADGTFVYTGFKTAFVMIKKTDSAGNYWHIYDNKRSSSGGSNVINDVLYPNRSDAEYSEDRIDFVSNGFKIRTTNGDINTSGGNYIYMAFAQNPLVGTNGVPACAR